MYQVRIDQRKNRLYLTLCEVYRREAEELCQRLESECRKLKPGFACITDLSRQKKPLGRLDPYIYRAQKILVNAGMKKVVRIVTPGAEDIELQFEYISAAKVGYSAYRTTSMKLAEEILDKEIKQQHGDKIAANSFSDIFRSITSNSLPNISYCLIDLFNNRDNMDILSIFTP